MKYLGRLITVLLFALGLASTALAQSSATIKKIKDEGVLRVAMADSPPSQSKNPATGQWEGYNVDMARDLAKVLGVKLEIVDSTWATLIPGLMAGKYDTCLVDMFATPERAQTVIFTESYNTLGYSFIVQADSRFKTWEDLNEKGVVIATLSGTSGEPYVEQNLPKATMRSIVSDNNYAPHLEVANGRADAHITDHVNNLLFIKKNPTSKLRAIPDSAPLLNATGLAYPVRPDDRHFLSFLNTWIRYNRDSGKAEALRKKWFGT